MLEISAYVSVGLAWTILLTALIIIDAIALSYLLALCATKLITARATRTSIEK